MLLHSLRQMFFGKRLLVAPIATLPFFNKDRNPMMARMKILFLGSFEIKCDHILTGSCEGEVLLDLPGLAFERNWIYTVFLSLFLQSRMPPCWWEPTVGWQPWIKGSRAITQKELGSLSLWDCMSAKTAWARTPMWVGNKLLSCCHHWAFLDVAAWPVF